MTNPDSLSVLGLAYIGDAVYELLVRTYLADAGLLGAHNMHSASVGIVNAKAQAKSLEKILDRLYDDEAAVYRRGRNAKVNSVPKNATEREYHEATGLEALFGWLWLSGRKERVYELFDMCIH